MLKNITLISALIFSTVGLTACGDNTPPAQQQAYQQQYAQPSTVAPAQAPIIIQQSAPQQNHDLLSAGLGAVAGYALASHHNNVVQPSYTPPTQIINRTVVVHHYIPSVSNPVITPTPTVAPVTTPVAKPITTNNYTPGIAGKTPTVIGSTSRSTVTPAISTSNKGYSGYTSSRSSSSSFSSSRPSFSSSSYSSSRSSRR